MTSRATHVKLGVFVAATLLGLVVAAFALGVEHRRETVAFHTYFDETVQGLATGAPVEYRGIPIGSVADIAVAPDGRHVDVVLAIWRDAVHRIDVERRAAELRATLAIEGLTGLKLVDIDWLPGATVPVLGFAPDRRYIPAQPSLLGRLSDQAELVLARTSATLDKLGGVFDDLARQHFATRAGHLLDDADGAVAEVRRVAHALARLDGLGDVEPAIRQLGDAARAVRELVDEIERQPDMLVKGRARERNR